MVVEKALNWNVNENTFFEYRTILLFGKNVNEFENILIPRMNLDLILYDGTSSQLYIILNKKRF